MGKKRSESVCAELPGRLDIPGCSVFPKGYTKTLSKVVRRDGSGKVKAAWHSE